MTITAATMLAKYLTAEAAVLEGKSITFNGRVHTMVDLDQIRKGRMEWQMRADQERDAAAGASAIGGLRFTQATFDR